MRATDLFTFAIGLLALMFLFGLLALWAGLIKETIDEQMKQLDRLPPAAQRRVRWQHWAVRYLPLPVLAGYVGTYVLAFATMMLDSATDGRAFWIYFTPSRVADRLLGVHVPLVALYFWGIVIASAVVWWRRGKSRGQWKAAVG